MRTQRATRFNHEYEHKSYGIYNWFASKGVKNKDVINEVIYAFCQASDFKDLSAVTPEKTKVNFIHNRFQKFANFGGRYLRENNYIPLSHQKV